MILKLLIGGEEKTFTTPFVSGMVWRKYIELQERMDFKNLKSTEVDEVVGLVIEAFGNKFTLEEFYNGIPHDEVVATVDRLFLPTPKKGEEEGNGKK